MADRSLPGIGLKGFWLLGENLWKDDMDANLRLASALIQGRVISRTTTLPGSPSDGDIYIVPAGAGSHPNEIAIRDAAAWVYVTPLRGWKMFVLDTSATMVFDGDAWAIDYSGSLLFTPTPKTADYTFAVADAFRCILYDSATAGTFTIPADADVEFPNGTIIECGQIGTGGLHLAAAGGVTLNIPQTAYFNKATLRGRLHKVSADVWNLSFYGVAAVANIGATAPVTASGAITLSQVLGEIKRISAGGNITSITLTGWPEDNVFARIILELKTNGHTIALPSSPDVYWPGAGTPPALSPDNRFVFFTSDNGATVCGATIWQGTLP